MAKCIVTEDSYYFPKDRRVVITKFEQIRHLLKLKYLLITDEPELRIFDSEYDIVNICKKYDKKKCKGYDIEVPKPDYVEFAQNKKLAQYKDLGRIEKHLQLKSINKKVQPFLQDSDFDSAIKFKNFKTVDRVESMYYFLAILSSFYRNEEFHKYILEVDLHIRNFNLSEQDALVYLHALRKEVYGR